MSGLQIDSLIRRWIFPMVRIDREFVIPMGDGAIDRLRNDGSYDPLFIPFLKRFLDALADPAWAPGSYFPAGWYRALRASGLEPLQAEATQESLEPFYGDELHVNRHGGWRLGNRPVQGRVLQFFLRNLFFDEDLGLYYVRYQVERLFDRRYLHHESPPYRVVAVELGRRGAGLVLNDGTREPLVPESLWLDAAEELHCPVKSQHLPARFAGAPRWELLKDLQERDGRLTVQIAGRTIELPQRS